MADKDESITTIFFSCAIAVIEKIKAINSAIFIICDFNI